MTTRSNTTHSQNNRKVWNVNTLITAKNVAVNYDSLPYSHGRRAEIVSVTAHAALLSQAAKTCTSEQGPTGSRLRISWWTSPTAAEEADVARAMEHAAAGWWQTPGWLPNAPATLCSICTKLSLSVDLFNRQRWYWIPDKWIMIFIYKLWVFKMFSTGAVVSVQFQNRLVVHISWSNVDSPFLASTS